MGRPIKSLIGKEFDKLTVIGRAESAANRQTRWLCLCECGRTCIVYGVNLKSGKKVSCGECTGDGMGKKEMRQTSDSLDRLRRDVEDPYLNLANAIVAVAVDDYRTALKSGNEKLTKHLERFFHSGWYRMLTSLDAEVLMGRLRHEHESGLKVACV